MLKALLNLAGSEQDKLIAGLILATFAFILTTIGGAALTYFVQLMSWRRQAKLDLFLKRYQEGIELLAKVSNLIDRRFFRLQRYIWAIEACAPPETIAKRESEYFETVYEWNDNLRSVHNGIRLLIDEAQALNFLDYADDDNQDDPHSIHYSFVKVHRLALQAKDNPAIAGAAELEAKIFNRKMSIFLFDLTTVFEKRANSLGLLKLSNVNEEESRLRHTSRVANKQ